MTPKQRAIWVKSMGARSEWWARRWEPIVEPDWEVIDTHCHLWIERDVPDPESPDTLMRTSRYMADEFLRDTGTGHRVEAFVYAECGSGYYADGPAHMRPVGETEFATQLAKHLNGANGKPHLAAIAAYADLKSPDLGMVLDAHAEKSADKVRAIRHSGARLEDPSARLLAGAAEPGLYENLDFQRGVALLGERELHFEAFQFHFQLEALARLVERTPVTIFVINHLGAPIGYGRGEAADKLLFADWARGVEKLARFPNVVMKLGGLASPVTEYDAALRDFPPSSEEFVAERGAYFYHAIRAFGTERCMFESNFPVDSVSLSYATLWNAFKMIAGEFREVDRKALLAGTASRLYGIAKTNESAAYGTAAQPSN